MMAAKLTAGAWSILCNGEQVTEGLKAVVQVTDIWRVLESQILNYKVMLSDGLYCHQARLDPNLNDWISSEKLHKGSIVRLTGYGRFWFRDGMILIINNFELIFGKGDNIIGDPKPFDYGVFHAKKAHIPDYSDDEYDHVQETPEHSCPLQIPTTKQKQSESSIDPNNKFVVSKQDVSNNAGISSMMEKNKEDDGDVDACIEKLEKLGWKTQDSLLYDTALLMFGESGVYRKLWLHLVNHESCEKWVRNAGSKYGLLELNKHG